MFNSCSKSSKLNSNINLHEKISFLDSLDTGSLTVNDVIKLKEAGKFSIPFKNKIFQQLEYRKTWLHFRIDNPNQDLMYAIWNPFITYAEAYTVSNNNEINNLGVQSLEDGKLLFYRFPVWKIEYKNQEFIDVYVKVRDKLKYTCMKTMLYDTETFITFTKVDYIVITIQIALFVLLTTIIIVLFIAKKGFNILWYGAYILIFLIEFTVHKGLDLHFFAISNPVWHLIKKLFLGNIGVLLVCKFFIHFYPFTSKTNFIKYLYKAIVAINIVFFVICVIDLISARFVFSVNFIWLFLQIEAVLILLSHMYLAYKKVLPNYLGFAFTIPTISSLSYFYARPAQNLPMLFNFTYDNLFYIGMTVEIIAILYYIVTRFRESEFKAMNLKKENLKLRNEFQDGLLKAQYGERNKLLSNVHDSFGGYLEALKMRLLNRDESTPQKIQEILDAFYKDYRYLLNNLHSPKINGNNFIENLTEFCDKMDAISDQEVVHEFALENVGLPQEKCMHLYMIISELITNAIKHSNAKKIKLSLQQINERIKLVVSDNGLGFNTATVKVGRYGLKNIEERVSIIGGELTINSKKGLGTTVEIKV